MLCDLIRSRSKLDKALMIQALKSYAVDRKRNMTKLMTYAVQFDVANIIRTYLEVL